MRNITAQSLSQQIKNLSEQYARLCSSCPSLSEQGSDPDILSSLNSSPTHHARGSITLNTPDMLLKRGSADWQSRVLDSTDLMRRRSWAALDGLDTEETSQGALKVERHRSVSLSSMESDMDYLLGDSTANLLSSAEEPTGVSLMRKLSAGSTLVSPRRTTRLGGNSSTHSLNEADLQSDFNKVLAKREAESRLLSTIKLPLQKSISTPSILGPRDLSGGEVSVADSTTLQTLPVSGASSVLCRPSGTESETEEELLQRQYVKHHFTDDDHTEKRRKRGSLFFRKKKSYFENIIELYYYIVQILEDKDGDHHHHHHHDHVNYSDETPLVPFEFLDESPITAADLDTDPQLGLQEEDSDSWMPTVSKDISKKLKEKEIKRQEHIYEFILTEKHHCLTLTVMQKVFVDGIQKHFHLGGPSIDRMFPRLKDLTEIHMSFLSALKRKQKEHPVVDSIADILLEKFSGAEAARLKTAYGEFCSRHRDAVNFYKEYFSNDARFAEFVKHCQLNPLLKKKGIPECILFVTQRLTKYPLLIEPLIKTSKENKLEQEKLNKAQLLIKVFVDGIQKHFHLGGPSIDRMFPRLKDLTEIHMSFLSALKRKQKEHPVVDSIADILLEKFSVKYLKIKMETTTTIITTTTMSSKYCYSDETPLVPFEFLDESPITAADLDTDPQLGLQEEDSDSWMPTVSKDISKKLKEKEIKRQEHIYEFILTEKHHCLTLTVMQKVFVDGIQKHFHLGGPSIDRMFPRLKDLTEIHMSFLSALKRKQKEHPVDKAKKCSHLWVSASYSTTLTCDHCSKPFTFNKPALHCENCAVTVHQTSCKENIPVCSKIKANKVAAAKIHSKKSSSSISSQSQLSSIKYTFFTPDNKTGVISLQKLLVREKAGVDSRSIYLISSNPAEPEMFELKVIKPKEKQAWIDAIRSAVQNCPEDVEDGIGKLSAEDKQKLLEAKQAHIRQIVDASLGLEGLMLTKSQSAVQNCPEDVEDGIGKLSAEDKQKLLEAKQAHIRQIVAVLRQKDAEQALILEEKMSLQLKLLAAAGVPNVPSPPSYTHLVAGPQESSTTWQHVMTTVKKVNQLASSLYTSGSNLSRSVSSVGEHQSQTYISPTLPKRAETFGGFDTAQPPLKGVHKKSSGKDPGGGGGGSNNSPEDTSPPLIELSSHTRSRLSLQDTLPLPLPPPSLFTLGQEQQVIAMELSHHVYTLSCIIAQQMTSIDSLQAQLSAYRSQAISNEELPGKDKRGVPYRHNIQLEELRNLQDRLQQEKEAWTKEKEAEEKDLEERKAQLVKIQEQVKCEQNDIAQQREQLYRRLEILTSQGILISPNMPLTTTGDMS
ncbi:uncharacterized protein LOC103509770, partial [Diaphorina citri]|uniref:Uncharacterized protein LOC103509770 n=1 Tax=Diaphorina citri TaxID=121845 RepID=A0A3Q0IU99_DIACI